MSAILLEKMHKYSSGAKIKGYIKNNSTGEKLMFYFNPPELEWSRSVTYQEISSPGLSYPLFSYVKGNSTPFNLPLKVIDNPSTGLIDKWEKFFAKLLPPTSNSGTYIKPDDLTVVMGGFIKECIAETITTKYERWDTNLVPIECTFTLTLRQV